MCLENISIRNKCLWLKFSLNIALFHLMSFKKCLQSFCKNMRMVWLIDLTILGESTGEMNPFVTYKIVIIFFFLSAYCTKSPWLPSSNYTETDAEMVFKYLSVPHCINTIARWKSLQAVGQEIVWEQKMLDRPLSLTELSVTLAEASI